MKYDYFEVIDKVNIFYKYKPIVVDYKKNSSSATINEYEKGNYIKIGDEYMFDYDKKPIKTEIHELESLNYKYDFIKYEAQILYKDPLFRGTTSKIYYVDE